jgi:hypothetical protein
MVHGHNRAGLAVTLHPTPPTEPLFAHHLALPLGILQDERDAPGTAWMAAHAWQHAGAIRVANTPHGSLMPGELGAYLEGLGCELTVDAQLDHTVFTVGGPAEHAARALEVMCALAFGPLVDADVLADSEDALAEQAHQRLLGDGALAEEVIARWAPGMGVLAAAVFPAVEEPDARGVPAWMERAGRVEDALLVASGPVEAALRVAAEQCAPRRLPQGSAPRSDPARAPASEPTPSHPGRPLRVFIRTQDAGNAFVRVGGAAPPPGTPAALTLDVALQSQANGFTSALVTRLRTERGLVYGVDAQSRGNRRGGMFSVGTSTAPAHAAEVVAALEDGLRQLHLRGLPPNRWRALARASALSSAAGSEVLQESTARVLDALQWGLPPNGAWLRSAQLWSLDVPGLWTSARAHVDPERLVTVVVGPPQTAWGEATPDVVRDVRVWAGTH